MRLHSPRLTYVVLTALGACLLAGCGNGVRTTSASTMAFADGVTPTHAVAPTIVERGSVSLRTASSVVFTVSGTQPCTARNPTDCAATLVISHEYTAVLTNGAVTITDQGTLVLESGSLYVRARATGTPPPATHDDRPDRLVLYFYPLIKTRTSQGGTVLALADAATAKDGAATENGVVEFLVTVSNDGQTRLSTSRGAAETNVWFVPSAAPTSDCNAVRRLVAAQTIEGTGTPRASEPGEITDVESARQNAVSLGAVPRDP
ncbi:MAG: hypothetical protein JNM94_02730 [Phycisphaerae bacterium]|nr:hypothetical protein [Phycisphaerae bacterium]